jgi:hypothetical protein
MWAGVAVHGENRLSCHMRLSGIYFRNSGSSVLRLAAGEGPIHLSAAGHKDGVAVPDEQVRSRPTWCDELTDAAVATTTTLLAALWPERHFVFDRRIFAAVNGLRIAGGLSPTAGIDVSSAHHPGHTFEEYEEAGNGSESPVARRFRWGTGQA